MYSADFPVIDLAATGQNIIRIRKALGLSVRDIQQWFGFEEPQAVYKWQQGKCLPTVDNLLALSILFGIPMNQIIITKQQTEGQQAGSCCPSHFILISKKSGFCIFMFFQTHKQALKRRTMNSIILRSVRIYRKRQYLSLFCSFFISKPELFNDLTAVNGSSDIIIVSPGI